VSTLSLSCQGSLGFFLTLFWCVSARRGRYSIPAATFEAKYQLSPADPRLDDSSAAVTDNAADDDENKSEGRERARTAALRAEGFQRFAPVPGAARVWALQLSAAACQTQFPAGCFEALWGERMAVVGGDWLALTFPVGTPGTACPVGTLGRRHQDSTRVGE
jgi:hypothetical protein